MRRTKLILGVSALGVCLACTPQAPGEQHLEPAAVVLTGASTQPLAPNANPQTASGPTSQTNLATGKLDPGAAIISNNTASIIGKMKMPSGLVETTDTAYRLITPGRQVLDLAEQPVASATVTLQDSQGNPISEIPAVTTDAQGNFRFDHVPRTIATASGTLDLTETFFVRGAFTQDGASVSLTTPAALPATGDATTELDSASTLTSQKLVALAQSHQLDVKTLKLADLLNLVAQVRAQLQSDGTTTLAPKDLVSAFDQLLIDHPAIAQDAGALAAALGKPSETWHVDTVLTSDTLVAKGVLSQASNFKSAGLFTVDRAGNLYMPSDTSPVKIWQIAPDGTAQVYATLPAGIQPQVALAFSTKGVLYAVGATAAGQVEAFYGQGDALAQVPGTLGTVTNAGTTFLSGNFVVNDDGTMYMALPLAHAIVRKLATDAPLDVFAGAIGQAGYQDGNGASARFKLPTSLAIGPHGGLVVADTGNTCLRLITPDGQVTTLAGQPGGTSYRSGLARLASFGLPTSLVFDPQGDLVVSDPLFKRIRRLSPDGSVFLVAGSGQSGNSDGDGPGATFVSPGHMAIDGQGNLYVRDLAPDGASGPTGFIRKVSLH